MFKNILFDFPTTGEPMNGDHLHKALNRQDLEMMEKIIESR